MSLVAKNKQRLDDLRQRAEKLAQQCEGELSDLGLEEIRQLVYELAVYQIELEMQNDELERAQVELRNSRDSFYHLFNMAPVAYVVLDERGAIRHFNQAFATLAQRDETKLPGKMLAELVHLDDRLSYDVFFKHPGSRGETLELRLSVGADKVVHVAMAYRRAYIDQVDPTACDDDCEHLLALTDITARKDAEEKLKLSATVFESSSEGVIITDADNRIISVNQAFTTITGYGINEALGKTPRILNSGRQDTHFFKQFWRSLTVNGHWEGEIWNKRKNGDIYPEWLSINVLRDNRGNIYRHIGVFTDITERNQAQEIIRRQANYDFLTGLPNRFLFQERLEQGLRRAHRSGQPLALMFMDIDHFKEINDTLGHNAGDEVLKEIARRLQGCVRDSDTVARSGGDEFLIILNDLDESGSVDRVANAILDRLAKPLSCGDETLNVTTSIGISLYPTDTVNMEDLIKNADQAMYLSKQQGRNRYTFFTPSMQEAAKIRRKIANDLRIALAENQFELYYQPIVDLDTCQVYKAEALIRWRHPEGNLIGPLAFIPIAEEIGLINEIGNWVFWQVTEQIQHWHALYDPGIQVTLNKSPAQFFGDANHHLEWIRRIREKGIPSGRIVIEITEGLLLETDTKVLDTIRSFREAGIMTALDDFGTGYSSLSYLQKFGIDFIKIDRSFVCNLGQDEGQSVALCAAIIEMAHKLDMKVIAEGIETAWQRDQLISLGCDFGQGYFFAKPMPAADFESLLSSANRSLRWNRPNA